MIGPGGSIMTKEKNSDQTHEDIAWLDVESLRAAQAERRLSAVDVTEFFFDRIERLAPTLGAFVSLQSNRARERAKELDARRDRGEALGPLHGVPVALKDLCDVAGEPTRAGTTALGEEPATENAEVVDRLEAAGAIVLGKVKMTEGALVEHHSSVTPPRNPWNAERWTGISSSGSGVAVAAGLCTLALGTDTGGSIRYPSSACGLSGLKPTHGRVSLRGIYPLADSLDHIGPMARSAKDVARAFAVLCGHDPRDPWSRSNNPPVRPPSNVTNLSGKTIGFDVKFCEEDVDPQMATAVREALEIFKQLGATVVEFELPDYQECAGAWVHLGYPEIANAHAATYPSRKDEYGTFLAAAIEVGLAVDGRDTARAWKARTAFTRRLAGCFEGGSGTCPKEAPNGLDAMIAPVVPGRFPATANLAEPQNLPFGGSSMRFTSPFNLSGSPSLTMCGGFDGEGAPIGFQLIGADLAEDVLLELGAGYQGKTDYHLKRPNLALDNDVCE